ncbi:hypothetical protein [Shewanella xiamenensis]|uniref:Uncharacterized protein n=1 Tax=Shewanella xiamenensis TaxID=332186 RepID=A0ABT6UIW4_9GAMM|nr:hypothetical protein [Shewanella xiamenensis]MDI5833695.1 hypothetical protein [Shewanella xiamenensis]
MPHKKTQLLNLIQHKKQIHTDPTLILDPHGDANMLKSILADNASSAFNQFACRFVSTIAQAQNALNPHQDMHSILKHVDAIDNLYIDYCQKTLPEHDKNAMAKVVEIENNINPKNITRHLQGRPNRVVALEEYFNDHPSTDDVLLGLRGAIQYDKTYFDKIVASLLPLLEKLGTGNAAEIITSDDISVASSVVE